MTEHTRRTPNEGAVYKTGKEGGADRGWRASLLVRHPITGVRVRRYVSGRSKTAVVRKLDALKAEAKTGYPTGETVGQYLARWLPTMEPQLRPSTFRSYAQHVRDHWTPLSSVPLTRLTPADVNRAMAALIKAGRSPLTVQHSRSTLRKALHDAQIDGLVTRNAAGLAHPPRAEHREMRALNAEEVRALLAATADDEYGPIYALAIGSGLRLGELMGLAWTDVDEVAGVLTVRHSMARTSAGGFGLAEPKTRQSRRTVVLPGIARSALKALRARQDAARTAAGSAWQGDRLGLVCTDRIGRPLDNTVPSRAFREAADRLGLAGVRFHDLRHTNASLMLNAGVALKTISESLGHSTIAVTSDTYAHIGPELRREAAAGLDRALSE